MTPDPSSDSALSLSAHAVVGAKAGKRRRRVLIVDDEKVNVDLLSRCLSQIGYEIFTASNGREALDAVYTEDPDLVLLDVSMPVMDGLTVCRTLRDDVTRRSLPIVMVTARHALEDRLAALRAGVDDFIGKPFDLTEVQVRMESILERRRWDLGIHPMTRLPGSPGIEDDVWRRLRQGMPFAFAYIDIDNFKAYNDVYGYDAGDRVLKHFAGVLIDTMRLGASAFAGHIGGDDFVFIAGLPEMTRLLETIRESFDTMRNMFYDSADVERNCIRTKNRSGDDQTFPLMSLSTAVVSTATRRILHYARLVEIVSELKGYVKKLPHHGQSLVVWDRRKDPHQYSDSPPLAGARKKDHREDLH